VKKGKQRAHGRVGRKPGGKVTQADIDRYRQDHDKIVDLQEAVHEFLVEKFPDVSAQLLGMAMMRYTARIAHQALNMNLKTFGDVARGAFRAQQREAGTQVLAVAEGEAPVDVSAAPVVRESAAPAHEAKTPVEIPIADAPEE
jgi:hypothetical protein